MSTVVYALFGKKFSDRPTSSPKWESVVFTCQLDNPAEQCDLYKRGECICADTNVLSFNRCIHATHMYEESPAGERASSFPKWQREKREQMKGWKLLDSPYKNRKVSVVGDYVYFPYSHSDMCPIMIKPKERGLFASSGKPYIRLENFSAEHIVEFANFRPQAMMNLAGNPNDLEIKVFQQEIVPKFLYDAKARFPELFEEAMKLDPALLQKMLPQEVFDGKPVSTVLLPPGKVRIIYKVLKDDPQKEIEGDWDGDNVTFQARLGDVPYVFGGLFNNPDVIVTVTGPAESVKAMPDAETLKRLYEGGKLR